MSTGQWGAAASSDDDWRDAFALVVAFLRDDRDGQDVILANAGLRQLAVSLAALAAGATGALIREWSGGALPDDKAIEFAEQALISGMRSAGVWRGGEDPGWRPPAPGDGG